jgi:hypothetical protein
MALQAQVTDNVRVLAAVQGTTPTAAARSVGISAERLHAKLQGRVRWNVEDLEALATAFGVDPAMLVGSLTLSVVNGTRDAASATSLASVRPKGLEPPTFWLIFGTVVRNALTCRRSGFAQSREGWVLGA